MKRLLQHSPLLAAAFVLLPALLSAGPIGLSPQVFGLPGTGMGGQPAADSLPEASTDRVLSLERILINGNRHLKDEDILEAIHLAPGDMVNVEVLERARVRLLDTYRILSRVDFFSRPGSARGSLILEIEVVERKTFSFETGYGYHDVNGWFLTLAGLRFDHLHHTDSMLRLGFRLGFNLVSLDAEWEKPAPVDGGLGADARLYLHSEDRSFFGDCGAENPGTGDATSCSWSGSEWNEFRQKIVRVGGEVSALYWMGGTRFSFGVRVESVRPESTFYDVDQDENLEFEDFPNALQQDIEQSLITGVFLRATRDTRDDVIYPRSGSVILFSMEANSTILGGDKTFTRIVFDSRKLADLGGDRVLSGRLSAGITSWGTPYYERFTLGGIYSIRGFRELSLSATAGDDGYWIACCELRFPLISSIERPPRLSGLVFFDSGMGWQRGTAFSAENLEAAVGYGVRLRLPWLGMLGLDVGIPLSEGRTGENFRVHGALGFSF